MKKIKFILLFISMAYCLYIPCFAAPDYFENLDLEITSKAAVLIDASTGQVIYGKNADEKMYPASITKVMTGMLALREGSLSDVITMSHEAVFSVERDSSHIALDEGEQITLEQALYATAIASANDAANGIGEHIGGSIADFVAMMNSAAVKAGALNTNFVNTNGLPDENHYTTAYDMALITAEALKLPDFVKFFGARRCEIAPTNKQPETRILNSINKFNNGEIPYDGLLFSKTGWTSQSHHTLVTAAERNGITLIAVVLDSIESGDKWSDTIALFDYGFEQFSPITIAKEEILLCAQNRLAIYDNDDKKIDLTSINANDISILLPNGTTPGDVIISCGEPVKDIKNQKAEIPITLSLPETGIAENAKPVYKTAISAALQSEIAAMGESRQLVSNTQPEKKLSSAGLVFLIIGVAFALFILFLYIRMKLLRARRKRKRRMQSYNYTYQKDKYL